MREFIVEKRDHFIQTAKTCDMCRTKVTDIMELQEFVDIHVDGGYSSIFGDGVEFTLDICQHCVKKIIDHFNIAVDYEGIQN